MADDAFKPDNAPDDSAGVESAEAHAVTMVGAETLVTPRSLVDHAHNTSTGPVGAHVIDGRYELVALLGQGGMGNVYKARDQALDEIVALKTLKQELVGDANAVQRFRAEVKLARQVTHRNVARTFDLGVCEDVPYLTMEYVEGEDLAAVLTRERRLALERFMELARPVCKGLAAAHSVGVVHRDLKPHNIIVARDGRVVLTDFGIAHASQSDHHLTGEGVPLGTPAYMAPEQVQSASEIDHRADIYALGVLFFEMLTAQLPFVGQTPIATALARLLEEPPDLSKLRADVPDPVAAVIARCLAREREERFQRVDEVLDALDRAVAGLSAPRTGIAAAQTLDRLPAQAPQAPGGASSGGFDAQSDDLKRVAVLPFRVGANADDAYIADGLTEDLIDELSMSRSLKVRPRGAVMPYKGSQSNPREIGRALSVQVVVDGSIRRAGDALRIRLALISVDDGFQIWAKRFKANAAELFDISEAAARAIVDALTADALVTPRPNVADTGAIDLYLRARHQMHASWFTDDMSSTTELFERALALAPDDPRILAGAASAYARASFFDNAHRDELLGTAQDYAQRALQSAPSHPEPRLALARVHTERLEFGAATAHLRQVIAQAPSNADAHDLLGRILREVGPLESSIRHLQTALDLNPHMYISRWDLAPALALQGRFEEVDRLLELPVDSEQERNAREAARTRIDMWRAQPRWLAEGEERPLQPSSPQVRLMCAFRRELMQLGELSEAHQDFRRRALSMSLPGTRFNLMIRQLAAEAMSKVGEVDEALTELEAAARDGLRDIMWLERCPLFDDFRDHPRFRALRDVVQARVDQMMQ